MKMLIAVAKAPNGLGARELSKQFNLTLPTTYHVANTLALEGILSKDSAKKYRLGPGAAAIAHRVDADNQTPCHFSAALHELARLTGETAYLSGWHNNQIRVLESVEGAHAVSVADLSKGYANHLHARASGKVLLAFAQPDFRAKTLEDLELPRLTERTITSKSAFERELALVRARGVGYDHQEFSAGVDCIAAPIWINGVVVAALTVSSPSSRFADTETELLAVLKRAAARAGAIA